MTHTPITEAGPAFARATLAYSDLATAADMATERRGRVEFEVAVKVDGTVLLDLYAHSPERTRVELAPDSSLAINLRGLLLAAQAGAIG
jgi:hypothetical protein